MLGVVLAALSAATFAFNNASARRGVLTGSVAQALAITVPIGVPMFLLAALTTGQLGALSHFSGAAMGLLALAGVLHFVVGRYGNFRAAQAIGANLSGPVIQLSLGITLILAVLVLKEPMTPLRILGIALLVSAPALMRNATPEATEQAETSLTKFQPRYAEGYAFSIMAALAYGVTPLLIRLAVTGGGGLGTGLAGGLVSYAAATAAVALLLLWPGQWRHALAVTPESREVVHLFRYLGQHRADVHLHGLCGRADFGGDADPAAASRAPPGVLARAQSSPRDIRRTNGAGDVAVGPGRDRALARCRARSGVDPVATDDRRIRALALAVNGADRHTRIPSTATMNNER